MGIHNFLHKRFVKTTSAPKADLTGMYAIVTGAALDSLGYETAKTLANWGAIVIVTTRRDTQMVVGSLKNDLDKQNGKAMIDGHTLDLCNAESVNSFTKWYRDKYGQRLDILMNNAGIHQDLMSKRKEPLLTPDGHEIHWRTNYLGTAHLTHNLLPLLLQTGKTYGEARIVNVGSQLHVKGSNEALFNSDAPYNSWRAYGASKLALIHFTTELQRRYSSSNNLKAYCLHPGGVSGARTNIAEKGFEGQTMINTLRKFGQPLERLFMATADEGAQTQIFCAVSASAIGGEYYQNCVVKEASKDANDKTAAKRLWTETVEWLTY